MFLKLLLSTSLIIVSVFSIDYQITNLSKEDIYMQSSYVLPTQYNIILTSNIEKDTFVGNYNISIEILQSTQRIDFYLDVRRVIDITVIEDLKYSDREVVVYKPVNFSTNNKMNIAEYIFKDNIYPGNYIIKLICNITGTLKKFYERNKREWLAVYVDIQHMIPCLPTSIIPRSKIFIEQYKNYTVLSNIPIQEMDDIITQFNTTLVKILLVPNYLVFLTNLYPFTSSNAELFRVDLWCRIHTKLYCEFARNFVGQITQYMFYILNFLHTVPRVNYVAIPDFQNESIINRGLIIYGEADILYIENVEYFASKIKISHFLANKIVQECFYYKNPLWSSFSWLNQAAVVFLELYVMDEVFPNTRMTDLFLVQFQHESFHFNTEYSTSIYNTSFNNSFEYPRYIKGYSAFRMLQQMVNEKAILEIIHEHVKNYKPSDHFDEIMKDRWFIKEFAKNYSMRQIINSWTIHKYCPVLKVTRHYDKYLERIAHVSISHNLYNENYDIAVTCTIQTRSYYNHTIYTNLLLNLLRDGLVLPHEEDVWILCNIQQTGYYRVNYDIENWRRIASYLNSENYTNIHVLNRAQIIDDAFHLMITDQVDSIVFWNITKYLTGETDYVAWYPMFKAIEYLSNIFLFSETMYFNIKMKIRNLLYDLLDKLGYDEVSDEDDLDKCLRVETVKWACNLQGRICIEAALRNLNRHLADSETNMLLPWWKEWTYCQGLKVLYYSINNHEDSPWWKVYYLGKKKFRTKFLKFLACNEDTKFIKDYLNLIKNETTTSTIFFKDFSDQDYINYFLYTIAKHARKPPVLDFILHNLENIKPKQVSEYVTFTIIINHVYSAQQLEKIINFLSDKFLTLMKDKLNVCKKVWFFMKKRDTKVETSEAEIAENDKCLEQYILNIKNKIQTRSFEIKSQQNYFKNFVKYQ